MLLRVVSVGTVEICLLLVVSVRENVSRGHHRLPSLTAEALRRQLEKLGAISCWSVPFRCFEIKV